ncbi:MAG: CerR family C-terminal domain-containing protein [Caldimonas sp.]
MSWTPPALAPRSIRKDGELSRARLLEAALRLFAQNGFARTSTRDIAEASGSNLAAISYYFGDKAGLYRAVIESSMRLPELHGDAADTSLEATLRALYAGFLEPLKQGDLARQCMKLHMREMIEPTGLWSGGIAGSVQPLHESLVAALRHHLGLRRADDEVRRLAICIAALGVHLHLGCDVTETLAPGLGGTPAALDAWLERLVMYATAMVAAEAARRKPARAARSRATVR